MTTPLNVAVQPFFWKTVQHELPGDFDQPIKFAFKVKYRRPEQEQVEALIARIMANAREQVTEQLRSAGITTTLPDATSDGNDAVPADQPKPITDQEVINEYVMDWSDVLGDDNLPLPYTPDNMARVEKLLGTRAAIVRTFLDTFMKEPEKNSGPRRGTSTK